MNTSNGHIVVGVCSNQILDSVYKEMLIPPTAVQMSRRPPRVGRNERCPCGSGLKFKKCCLT